jgi:hypothetical protein
MLQVEYLVESAAEPVRPKIRTRGRVDQPPGDAHAINRLAHAAAKDIAHDEFAVDLLHIRGTAALGRKAAV